ncbi:hybrid nucleoside-diphosphate sugar epimerase/sugar transferase [Pelagibacterium mangrovi]|uniref:hybrid nucleoside-diphosphate sugar epimerase/sugar transferase n=1 Tax=Pelagibacterium mangrovi TaxID=3119828 RepID=UPI002FC7F3FE
MIQTNLPIAQPRIVVTGASGRLGQQLVPLLKQSDAIVIVTGRDPQKLHEMFPSDVACNYEEIPQYAAGADLLVHLAVLNNDVEASQAEFERVNVDLTLRVAKLARAAGITRMLNISSTHALDENNHTPYAETKRRAARELAHIENLDVVQFFLPTVIGAKLAGTLAALNKLPTPLRGIALSALSALKPTLQIGTLAQAIWQTAVQPEAEDRIVSDGQARNVWFRTAKRAIDLAFALVVLVFFWWLLLIVGIAIKLQSPGPAIFAQERVGRDGRTFICYKFRTMRLGTPNVGSHDAPVDAITPIGKFMRSSKLDELPQVWNIIRNDISLVGPRPCLPIQAQLIDERHARGVLSVKPGITGLAQVNGIDMSEPKTLALWDERYLKLQSLLFDLEIILKTALGKGAGDRTK